MEYFIERGFNKLREFYKKHSLIESMFYPIQGIENLLVYALHKYALQLLINPSVPRPNNIGSLLKPAKKFCISLGWVLV